MTGSEQGGGRMVFMNRLSAVGQVTSRPGKQITCRWNAFWRCDCKSQRLEGKPVIPGGTTEKRCSPCWLGRGLPSLHQCHIPASPQGSQGPRAGPGGSERVGRRLAVTPPHAQTGGAASSIPSPVSPRYWHWGAPIAPWVFPIMWDPGTDASGSSSLHCRLPSQVPQSPGGPPPLVSLIHTSGWYLRAGVVRVLPQDWSPILCALVTPGLDLPSRSVWMCPSCPGLPSDQAQGLSWGGGWAGSCPLLSPHSLSFIHTVA